MIVEWNTHIFHPDRERYPFHRRAKYTPDLSAAPADPLLKYIDRMQELAIDRAVLVHPEPYGDDHRLVLDCLERYPDLFLGTSLFYPRDADAPQRLQELVERQPAIVSTRFHTYPPYLDSLQDEGVRTLWVKAVELELIVELHLWPGFGAQVGEMIRDLPDSVVLIDHLAEPQQGNPVEYAEVLALSQFDQVYMKLSGLSHFAHDEPLYESTRSFTSRVIDEFGPQRMVWGSGTPEIVDAHMGSYSEADRELVKGGNLRRLLGW